MAITIHAFEKIDCERFYGFVLQSVKASACKRQALSVGVRSAPVREALGDQQSKMAPVREALGARKKSPEGLRLSFHWHAGIKD